MAGLVSMLPATDPRVFKLRGGNARLPAALLERANATLRLPAAVTAITKLPDGRWQLSVLAGGAGAQQQQQQQGEALSEEGPFDAVIIAAPLEECGTLEFRGTTLPVIPSRKFQRTVTTLVRGAVRPSFMGMDSMDFGGC